MSERINGIKINMERSTDSEVFDVLRNAQERLHRAQADVEKALAHAAARGLLGGSIGEQDVLDNPQ